MKSAFKPVSLGPNPKLPQNEWWKINTFAGGFNAADAQEDLPPGASPDMQDMEVTIDDRLIRAPGVTLSEALLHQPTQMFLHAGPQYASALHFLAPPFFGHKDTGVTSWINPGLNGSERYGWTNFAGILLLSNGVTGIYAHDFLTPDDSVKLVPGSPACNVLTVFANRVVAGNVDIGGQKDFMGVAWTAASSDPKDWTGEGAAGQPLIGASTSLSDKVQAMVSLGYDTLAVMCRRSIWTGTRTGDVFIPIDFQPRLNDTGTTHAETVQSTEFGVLYLSEDGVRLFTGNEAPIVSDQINPILLPVDEAQRYSSGFDPVKKRYYLLTPTATWVLDLVKRRWFKWNATFDQAVFFPTQGALGPTWGQLVGTWGQQTLAWWQFAGHEASGKMYFLKGSNLGYEDGASFQVLGANLDPRWFDRRAVADDQDEIITHLSASLTYEATANSSIEVWLPKKLSGDYEAVAAATLLPGLSARATARAKIPFIHTGRGIGLGLRIASGSPAIRRASVEWQDNGQPFLNDGAPIDVQVPPIFTTQEALATVLFPIDNGVSALADGQFFSAIVTFPYEIVGYILEEDCDLTGSVVLKVEYSVDTSFPGYSEISGITERPTINNGVMNERKTLTTWAPAGAAYSSLRAVVVGNATNLTRVVLALALRKLPA